MQFLEFLVMSMNEQNIILVYPKKQKITMVVSPGPDEAIMASITSSYQLSTIIKNTLLTIIIEHH